MQLEIRIENLEEFTRFFDNAPTQMQDIISNSLTDLANEIRSTTTNLCPVRTGALRRSINVNISTDSINAVAGMDYASYVDGGTSKMRAQPFFEEPIAQILGRYMVEFEAAFDRAFANK